MGSIDSRESMHNVELMCYNENETKSTNEVLFCSRKNPLHFSVALTESEKEVRMNASLDLTGILAPFQVDQMNLKKKVNEPKINPTKNYNAIIGIHITEKILEVLENSS